MWRKGRSWKWCFLQFLNNYRGITPDIYIFLIDNYEVESKVETAVETGAKVMLFFNYHHDEKNTISIEVKAVKVFRKELKSKYICVEFSGKFGFDAVLRDCLEKGIV